MKNIVRIAAALALLMLGRAPLHAQDVCARLMREGDLCLAKAEPDYLCAINKYTAVLIMCPDSLSQARLKIEGVCRDMDRIRREAEEQRDLSEERWALIVEMFEEIQEKNMDLQMSEHRLMAQVAVTEAAKEAADSSRREAQQALERQYLAERINRKIANASYFYEGRFGLAVKQDEHVGPRFGYIDRFGNETMRPEYSRAMPFERMSGCAEVIRDTSSFLIDTLGNKYLLAKSLEQFGDQIRAVDLRASGWQFSALPRRLRHATDLRILLLGQNYALSELPNYLYAFPLQVLDLSYCGFRAFPVKIAALSNLQKLDLSGNSLEDFPEGTALPKGLRDLHLASTYLHRFPFGPGQLPRLHTLDLSDNDRVVADSLLGMKSLHRLSMVNCNLESLPPDGWQLDSLETLDLRGNLLLEIPPAAGGLEQLRVLRLDDNQIISDTGWLERLARLEVFTQANNPLQHLPQSLGRCHSLKHLDLSGCQVTKLPPSMEQLRNLRFLSISSNRLETLDPGLFALPSLTYLDLSDNPALSILPEQIGQLKNLDSLYMSGNGMRKLPDQIGELKRLTLLVCFNNQLGSLPASFANLSSLNHLDLSWNPLDSLPTVLYALPELQSLHIAACGLDSIPKAISQFKHLKELDLTNNQVSSLPRELASLRDLEQLRLSGNPLRGGLPEGLSGLGKLFALDIARCGLSGFPDFKAPPKSLARIEAAGNQFSSLPASFSAIKSLAYLDLNGNALPSLPANFGELENLYYLSLTGNPLRELPPSFDQLTSLTDLYLNNCQLQELPPALEFLPSLSHLDLSGNPFVDTPAKRRAAHAILDRWHPKCYIYLGDD